MALYTVRWKAFNITVEMTEEERQELAQSLTLLRETIDFPIPHTMFNHKVFSYQEAREVIASHLAVHTLP